MGIKNWIWTEEKYDADKPVVCFFRKTFGLKEKIEEPVYVNVSADTRYRLYVNGNYICTGPRKGDGNQWFYERVDIKPYLKEGDNVICASVLRYPAIPYRGYRSAWRTAAAGLHITFEDDRFPSTDKTWKSKIAKEIGISSRGREYIRLFQEETVYGSEELRDWLSAAYDDQNWSNSIIYSSDLLSPSVSPLFMKQRPIPLLYEKEKSFVAVHNIVCGENTKDDYNRLIKRENSLCIKPHTREVVDLLADSLTTAYLQLSISKGKGAKITFIESESYSSQAEENGFPISIKDDRLDYKDKELRGPVDEFYPGGYGTEDKPEYYEPFSFREFLLVRLDVQTSDEVLFIHNLSYRETAYPLEVKSSFESNDDSLKDIWRISENTLRMCMHETYEDCPGYEQLQYVMDARSQMLFTYCLSGDDRLARAAIDDISRSQRPDGLIAACYPSFKSNIIPSFSVYYVLMLHDHMMYFGDRDFLRKYYPSVMRICDFYKNHINGKNLIGSIEEMGFLNKSYWGYIEPIKDWLLGVPPVEQGKEISMMSLLALTLFQAASQIADYIGWHDLSGEYEDIFNKMRLAVRENCLGKNGLIQDSPGMDMYSQISQIFAVLNDVFTENEAIEAMKHTLDGSLFPCTLPVVFYQLRALEKTGLYENANKIFDRWRQMLKKNLTTCLEHDFDDHNRSDCHAWSSIPLYEMTSVILGVRPASPGFESIHFQPEPCGLSWAKGRVVTPRGTVKISWTMKDGVMDKEIQLPDSIKMV